MVALRKAGGQESVDRLARSLGQSFDETKKRLVTLEAKGLVWHAPKSRSFHLVEPLLVAHERALRRFEKTGIKIDANTIIDQPSVEKLADGADERTQSSMVDRLKDSGILAPAGKGKWKLGKSFLEYVRGRTSAH